MGMPANPSRCARTSIPDFRNPGSDLANPTSVFNQPPRVLANMLRNRAANAPLLTSCQFSSAPLSSHPLFPALLLSRSRVKGQEVKKPGTKQTWPKPLAERIRATEQALHAAGHAVTAKELAAHFSHAKTADLQEILESLVTLGRARQDGERFGV